MPAAGAAGFAPPAVPGAAQRKEGVLAINRNGDKKGHEYRSYFGAASPKISCWDVSSNLPELAPPGRVQHSPSKEALESFR